MFNAQFSSIVGGIGFNNAPSQAFTSHSIAMPLVGEEGLDNLRQFEQLNTANLRSFNPSSHGGDSTVFRTLVPATFQSQSEGFLGEYCSYGMSSMPLTFYDPALSMNATLEAGLHDHDYGVFNGMEEVYGLQQFESSSQIQSRRRKGVVMRGFEDYETQKNEKQRREKLGKKFELLKSLIPNPTKPDRATIISDTIDYIKELLRTLEELKVLVGKKRGKNSKSVNQELDHEAHGDMESSSIKSIVEEESDHGLNGSMRSSWIQRRSLSTFVDVRTIEDEVYIKLEQRKLVDCCLIVSRVLDELHLELMHFSAGSIGNSYIFTISTKTSEGFPVYASSVAKRFIEVIDG